MKHKNLFIIVAVLAGVFLSAMSCDKNKHLLDYDYYLNLFNDMPDILKPDPAEITSRKYFVVGDSVRVLDKKVIPDFADVTWLLDGEEVAKGISFRYKTTASGNFELVCRARYLDLERTDTTRLIVLENKVDE